MAVFAFMLLVTLGTTRIVAQDRANAVDDPEAYAVYAAALFNWGYEPRSTNLMTVAIEDRTNGSRADGTPEVRWCQPAFTGQRFGIDLDALATNFVSANAQRHKLVAALFKPGLQITLVSDTALRLSAVGFDDTRRWALVSVNAACCDHGNMFVFHKDDAGHWAVAKDSTGCSWIS